MPVRLVLTVSQGIQTGQRVSTAESTISLHFRCRIKCTFKGRRQISAPNMLFSDILPGANIPPPHTPYKLMPLPPCLPLPHPTRLLPPPRPLPNLEWNETAVRCTLQSVRLLSSTTSAPWSVVEAGHFLTPW